MYKRQYLCKKLNGYTDSCVISFVDIYKKTERNMKDVKYKLASNDTMLEVSKNIADIANNYSIKIYSCSELIDLSSVGIEHGRCIDDRLISKIVGQELDIKKDKNQRAECGLSLIHIFVSKKMGLQDCYTIKEYLNNLPKDFVDYLISVSYTHLTLH